MKISIEPAMTHYQLPLAGNDSFTGLFLLSKDPLEFLIVQGGTGKIESVVRRKEVLKPPR